MPYVLSGPERRIIKEFKQENEHVCHYCNKELNEFEVTADHKLPRCRGGKTEKGNLLISCYKCNREKDDKTYNDYLRCKNL